MEEFRPRRLLVTGGAGFIGSSVVAAALGDGSAGEGLERVVVLDALTYAGHLANLESVAADPRYVFVHGDICNRALVAKTFAENAIDAVLHLAAESHVDRSIESADVFVRTNVEGTFTLIDTARRVWNDANRPTRFVHVSTDEVFGALGESGRFTESSPYAPSSPYAASKAASDHLVRSFVRTHGFPAIVTNTCNNYGPRQLAEKLISRMVANAKANAPLPLYGEGKQVREWIHVDDHVAGLFAALHRGRLGESYNLGSGEESSNRSLVERIADLVDEELGRPRGTTRARITLVADRKGHDFRYALDSTKARRELAWAPARALATHLPETVRWYLGNERWHEAVKTEELR